MAPKKKQPYVYFCLQKQQVDPGLKGKTLPELIDLCSEEWKSMNLVQRKPFIDTATLLTENPMAEPSFSSRQSIETSPLEDLNGKFDGFGRSFVALQSSIIQEKRFDKFMKEDISEIVKNPNFLNHRFHIMAVNIWLEDDSSGDIIPSEIALIEMTLKNGISRKRVQLIDPGELPIGFKSDMKINSEKYHDIWVDNLELIDSYGDIIDAIIDILKVQKDERYGGQNKNFNQTHDIMVPHGIECASKHKLLPIYVLPSQKKVISSALDWLARQANKDVSFMFYDLDFLFQQLVGNHPSDTENKLSLGAAEAYLTRDVYLYMASTSCSYHAKIESTKCAGALASRYAYVICDFCCQIFEIRPEEGGHMPWGISNDFIIDHSFVSSNNSFSESESKTDKSDRSFSDRSFVSVGLDEKPEPIELPVKTMPVYDKNHILSFAYDIDEDEEVLEFKSEEEVEKECVLQDDEFVEEQMLESTYFERTYADSSNYSEINSSTGNISYNAASFFENIPSPDVCQYQNVPSVARRYLSSPDDSDSFKTAKSG